MFYEFPKINHINQVVEAIKGRDEFVIAIRDGFTVINYIVRTENTFPKVESYKEAILRECRGITFCNTTGKVLSRKYHKFFNINETEEVQAFNIDLSVPHIVLEKLDGSMITPILVNDNLIYTTKMGDTDVAKLTKEFFNKNENYNEFSAHLLNKGFTPIFEFCSRKQKIVIDYPVERMVLTAVRDNYTGQYISYKSMKELSERFNIDCVKALDSQITNIASFMEEVKYLVGAEGYVIRFDNGHMLKVKADEYLRIHKALDSLCFEKDIILNILDDKMDDILPYLPKDIATKITDFSNNLIDGIFATSLKLNKIVANNKHLGKKDFAINVVNKDYKEYSKVLFKLYDNNSLNTFEEVKNIVKKSCSNKTNVDNNRYWYGGQKYDNRA